jgi:hypothetical protein
MRALPAAPDIESEEMLTNANVVSRRQSVFGAEGNERAVRGSEIANGEVVGVWVSPDCCVSAAHERVIGENDVSHFTPQDGLGARKIVAVAGNALDGLGGESGVTWSRWRSEDAHPMPTLRRQVPFRFFHDFKP